MLTDEQQMLQDTAMNLSSQAATRAGVRAIRDGANVNGFDRQFWTEFCELGFIGTMINEADGGLALGLREAGLIVDALGRHLVPLPFIATAVGGPLALAGAGAALREEWLPKVIRGDLIIAFALDEDAGFSPETVTTSVRRVEGGWRIAGSKKLAFHGGAADFFIVLCTLEDGDAVPRKAMIAASASAEGVEVRPYRLIDGSAGADVQFNDVVVARDNLLTCDEAAIGRIIDGLTIAYATELVALGEMSLEMTLNYLRERRQFGVAIGSFQALQHRAVQVHAELQLARAATVRAQEAFDLNLADTQLLSSVAKGQASLASGLATREGIQMHGGVGMTDEFEIGLYLKRQHVLALAFGDERYHTAQVMRLSGI